MKTPRGSSESSTTSDNTTEFIDIVKKYDVVYNTHNPDYKNVEVKMKIWMQIAEEIGLSIDASKRKWKNLRDSYTKYLRSFRVGTKTSKKYQYWAHADAMDFLKPYQGPGRNSSSGIKGNEDDDNECDLGLQVLTKATTSSDEDLKSTITTSQPVLSTQTSVTSTISAGLNAVTAPSLISNPLSNIPVTALTTITTSSAPMVLPVPSLPTVPLPPQLSSKTVLSSGLSSSLPSQLFSLPQINSTTKPTISMPASSTASSVGCLIIEPQLFTSTDSSKKELNLPALGILQSTSSQLTNTATTSKVNPPLITKIRRVHPSSQAAAINLCFPAGTTTGTQPPPTKIRKLGDRIDLDVLAILQANRELDSNTLFFLSLARTVRSMPTKFQSLAKMRCMRIVSDIELELDNANEGQGQPDENNAKYYATDSPSPPDGATVSQNSTGNEIATEHFVYVMSPSRVESMIDISSDEDVATNGN